MNGQKDQIIRMLTAGLAAHQQGHLDEAVRYYADVLQHSPEQPDALHLTGLVAFQHGELERAQNLIEKAITHNAHDARYRANLGRVRMAMGDYAAAAEVWQAGLTLDPESIDMHSDLAGALCQLDDLERALHHAETAIRLNGVLPQAHMNLGLIFTKQGREEEAIDAFKTAVTLLPSDPEAWFQLGRLYQQQGDAKDAEEAYEKALDLAPDLIEALNNLANLLRDQMRFEESIKRYGEALQAAPQRSDIHSNLGVALQEAGETERAIACYRKAIDLDAENAEAHRNLGMALLQSEAFEEGWKEYEWRWKTGHFRPLLRNWQQPKWQGEDISEQTLLVHCEQGFGDCLQFARYLPMAAARAKTLIVEAPRELAMLFERMAGVTKVIEAGAPLPAYDRHIPLMSLPFLFQTTVDDIPDEVPYLKACEEKKAVWRARLDNQPSGLRVGLVWQGSGAHQRNRLRSPGLDALRSLLETESDVQFVSLQKEQGAADILTAQLQDRIEDYTHDLLSFDDTAALISCLDVVIAPDTAVTHLAGALAVPTFLMLPAVSEWRWLKGRNDSPWYPETLLFRQKTLGDWSTIVQSISEELESYLKT